MRLASQVAGDEMTLAKVRERNAAIRLEFDVLTGSAMGLSARKACARLAQNHGVSYRHVWRILKAAP